MNPFKLNLRLSYIVIRFSCYSIHECGVPFSLILLDQQVKFTMAGSPLLWEKHYLRFRHLRNENNTHKCLGTVSQQQDTRVLLARPCGCILLLLFCSPAFTVLVEGKDVCEVFDDSRRQIWLCSDKMFMRAGSKPFLCGVLFILVSNGLQPPPSHQKQDF